MIFSFDFSRVLGRFCDLLGNRETKSRLPSDQLAISSELYEVADDCSDD